MYPGLVASLKFSSNNYFRSINKLVTYKEMYSGLVASLKFTSMNYLRSLNKLVTQKHTQAKYTQPRFFEIAAIIIFLSCENIFRNTGPATRDDVLNTDNTTKRFVYLHLLTVFHLWEFSIKAVFSLVLFTVFPSILITRELSPFLKHLQQCFAVCIHRLYSVRIIRTSAANIHFKSYRVLLKMQVLQ